MDPTCCIPLFIVILLILFSKGNRDLKNVTSEDLLNHVDNSWKSVLEIWTEAHKEKNIETNTNMSLEQAIEHMEVFKLSQLVQKQTRLDFEIVETMDETYNKAQKTFYRLSRNHGQTDKGKKTKPFLEVSWA